MTNFGIALRKIRLERQELLRDMAAKLNVSSAFLSAVETGKKKIPTHFVDRVCDVYNLSPEEKDALFAAADMSATELKIDLTGASSSQRQAAVSFAKAINGLTEEEINRIMRVFNGRKGK